MTTRPDLVQAQREIGLRGGLHRFIRMAWHIVRPGDPFVDNWNIGAIAEHYEAVHRGQIRRLIVNEPPGCMKSLETNVFFPAWSWIQDPTSGWFFTSFDGELTLRDAGYTLRLLTSEWCQARWGDRVRILKKDPAVGFYETQQGGMRFSTMLGGKGLGRHPDYQVIDDPTKPQNVTRDALDKTYRDFKAVLGNRFRNISTGRRILIMQRIHEDDLAGRLMAEGGYEIVRLPMRYEAARPCVTCLGTVDPRKEEGELLWPARFPDDELRALKLDAQTEASQMQQRPSPAGGLIFQDGWFGFWIDKARLAAGYDVSHLPVGRWKALPERFDFECLSLDATFKETNASDFVALGHLGKREADIFLTDTWVERADFTKTCEAFVAFAAARPHVLTKLIEDKANGPAIISVLRAKIPGLIPITPSGGKEARANAFAPYVKAGNFYVPDPAQDRGKYAWVAGALGQFTAFPTGKHDDIVDMVTQAGNYMHEAGAQFMAAMRALAERGKNAA